LRKKRGKNEDKAILASSYEVCNRFTDGLPPAFPACGDVSLLERLAVIGPLVYPYVYSGNYSSAEKSGFA